MFHVKEDRYESLDAKRKNNGESEEWAYDGSMSKEKTTNRLILADLDIETMNKNILCNYSNSWQANFRGS